METLLEQQRRYHEERERLLDALVQVQYITLQYSTVQYSTVAPHRDVQLAHAALAVLVDAGHRAHDPLPHAGHRACTHTT